MYFCMDSDEIEGGSGEMKRQEILQTYNLDVNWSYDEFNKKYPNCYKTTSFGSSYPRLALNVNDNDTLWIDFEYDLSKIRHIEISDEWGRRYYLYQRHGFWSWLR